MSREHDQNTAPALALTLDVEALKPLIAAVVEETVRKLGQDNEKLADGRLAYTEAAAATMLSMERHQLRDERRRGAISASEVVGKRIRYTRDDLDRYLAKRRVGGGGAA
jgi:hypothetical protein